MSYGVRFMAILLFGVTLGLATALASTGLPVPAAATLALVIVGAVALAVERKTGRDSPVLGVTFLSFGAIAGIAAMVQAVPQVNGWIIGIGTLIVEIALLIGVMKGYRKLAGQAGSLLRQRLAQQKGWTYAHEAEVPVPGPRTAPRLVAVPNDATSTTGQEVVYGAVNGLNFIVFDRRRPNDRTGHPQTVWLIQLPVALPYLISSYLPYLQQEEGAGEAEPTAALLGQILGLPAVRPGQPQDHTDHSGFGRVLLTPEVRQATTAPDFPRRWWIEGTYLCATSDGETANPKLVAMWVDMLTSFAARFPWPSLTSTPS
ncbi:hypothetical protein [Actinoplanes awajinensis]|nr:hypothetical protein [Actinoplanes awajinensis]